MAMAAAVERPCPACGRPELPPASDVPPSETLRDAMVEVLRFAEEFDSLDDQHYDAVTFADWLALSCAGAGTVAGYPGRKPHLLGG